MENVLSPDYEYYVARLHVSGQTQASYNKALLSDKFSAALQTCRKALR